MLKSDLLELLHHGESSGVEFKLDTIEARQLAKELVAFANFDGGTVLLGVDDDGSVRGITREGLEEWVMTVCRDKIRPEIIPYFQILKDVEPDRHVAVVRVERGWSVHHLWHHHHRTYLIRVGTQSREASPEELQRLFQQRGALRAELQPVSGSGLGDLDRRRLRDYFGRVRGQRIPDDEAGWSTLLENTELLDSESSPKAATIAGLLLFGENPNRFLPQAGIDAVAWAGKEKDYAARERASLRGPLLPLMGVEPDGRVVLIENGLVEQALDFVRRGSGVEAHLEGGRRIETPTWPEDAVREAVVNALVHRDYLLSSTDIELSLYPDRLEILSPGRLPNGITPDRMRAGCRAARNQLLKDIMRDYAYLEHMGMGVPRKIIRSMREHHGTEPDLVEDGESFLVRLRRRAP